MNCNKQANIYEPIIFFLMGAEMYADANLTRRQLEKLERLGLIEINWNQEYIYHQNFKELFFDGGIIKIAGNGYIEVGNVLFTEDGNILWNKFEHAKPNLAYIESTAEK